MEHTGKVRSFLSEKIKYTRYSTVDNDIELFTKYCQLTIYSSFKSAKSHHITVYGFSWPKKLVIGMFSLANLCCLCVWVGAHWSSSCLTALELVVLITVINGSTLFQDLHLSLMTRLDDDHTLCWLALQFHLSQRLHPNVNSTRWSNYKCLPSSLNNRHPVNNH